jgi:hypothetical protein
MTQQIQGEREIEEDSFWSFAVNVAVGHAVFRIQDYACSSKWNHLHQG